MRRRRLQQAAAEGDRVSLRVPCPFLLAVGASVVAYLGVARTESLASSAPPLAAYGTDIQQTSVSGVSSGAAMAVHMHVAHSSIMRGVGVVAGVAYDCADSRLPTLARLARALNCMDGSLSFGGSAGAAFSVARTTDAAGVAGAIDDPAVHLRNQKVWLFSGYNDGEVRRAAMDAVALYYGHYLDSGNVNSGNIFYQTDNHAPHALVTDDYGGACLGFNDEWINNCKYDAAGHLLEHIYGSLNARSNTPAGSILEFDQSEFAAGRPPKLIGLADTGFIYVPKTCLSEACRVHVVFHGCLQYAGNPMVGRAVVEHAGYNKWAETNKFIVLYPQTAASPSNPKGCWDWLGLENADFARKTGDQIAAIKRMLDRLAQKFMPGAGVPDTFGAPQELKPADKTSTSLALTWQPNSAAAGFNVYRSPSKAGPYTKINNSPVSGASFADRGLSANTTYHYEISAIAPTGSESARTPILGSTAPAPPVCDPYFSDNLTHAGRFRAVAILSDAFAVGSGDALGPLTDHSQLTKEDRLLPFYRHGYCP